LDIESLRLFSSLARELHFGRASTECQVSPSKFTRVIQRLEEQVGHQLFERDNRSVRLTPAGEIFIQFARETLLRWEDLSDQLHEETQTLCGHISIFATVTASLNFLPHILGQFRKKYPAIHLQLETGYTLDARKYLDEGFDVVVAALPSEESSDQEQRIIRSIRMITIAPKAECEVSRILDEPQIDWQSVPLILPTSGGTRTAIENWLHRENINPNIYSEVDGNEAAISLIALGCGVGFVPQLVFERSPLQPEVSIVRNGPPLEDIHIGFCTRKRKLKNSQLVQALWSTIG
jgi:LysR family transcriptional regulator, positive regulator for ilvC